MASRRLAAVPAPVLRDGIYVRVSAVMGRADDRFLSPEIQREAIDRARGRGPASRVVDEWRDIDVSTARVAAKDRPGLQAALTAAREGRIDRLWVLTLDRFDRDTSALRTFDEVTSLGVELWTEAGPLDVETPEGYLSVSMQLAVARYQRDRIGKAWRQAHEHRLARGLPHTGRAKAGYVYDEDARLHRPDPVSGPALADAYARYVAGQSFRTICGALNAAGVTTTSGGTWGVDTLRNVLDSGFAAGRITYAGTEVQGAHEPLIDAATWTAYRSRRATRAAAVNTERSTHVVSGLLWCGQCEDEGRPSRMVAAVADAQGRRIYRCRAARDKAAHAGGFVSSRHVEIEILAWLQTVATAVDEATGRALDLGAAVRRRDAERGDALAAARRRVERLAGEVEGLVRALAGERITEDEFSAAAGSARTDLAAARAAVSALEAQMAAPRAVEPARLAAALLVDWDEHSVAARREGLRRLTDRVVVWSGRPAARVVVVPAWEV